MLPSGALDSPVVRLEFVRSFPTPASMLPSLRRDPPSPTPRARRIGQLAAVASALALLAPSAHAQLSRSYVLLGNAQTVTPVDGGILIKADHGNVLIESVAGVGARIRTRIGEAAAVPFPTPHSLATGDAPPALAKVAVRDAGDTIVVGAAEGVQVRVTRHPVRVEARDAEGHVLVQDSYGAAAYNGRLAHYTTDLPASRYYALGEQPTGLARTDVYPLWNTDHFSYGVNDTPIYSTMPFYIGVTSGAARGILYDNPFRGQMDFANQLHGSIGYTADGGIDGGELRYYVIPGPGLDSVLARYTRLTGRMPLPPRWALGYQQSRYSYAPDTMLMNVAHEFMRRDIPVDAMYLDIAYMNGYRVFTWSPTDYPHPRQTLDSLARMGIRVVTIVDPGVKVDSAYPIYQELLANRFYVSSPTGVPILGTVWPGIAAYPDFSRAVVRQWWGKHQSALTDVGVAGIWNDMNEPASFTGKTLSELAQFDGDGHPGPHVEYHNEYGMLMARASYEGLRGLRPNDRPFVITRDGYPGVQRYSTMWTGDNQSNWPHLKIAIPMIISLGLTGEPFAGSDIGGFTGAPSGELYARWLQSAALIPFMRTHSAMGVPRREPWSYGERYAAANRATIRLHYRFLPALYSAFWEHLQSGAPVVRPVFWNTLTDSTALRTDDEYMLGDNVVVAPVTDSAADARDVYLPPGAWFRIGNDSAYTGGGVIRKVSAPDASRGAADSTALAGLPIFARAGAVIPMQPVPHGNTRPKLDTLELHVWPVPLNHGAVTSTLYEDAGNGYAYQKGAYRATTFTATPPGFTGHPSILIASRGSYAGARTFVVTLHATSHPRSVTVDGKPVAIHTNAAARTVTFTIPSSARQITVTP